MYLVANFSGTGVVDQSTQPYSLAVCILCCIQKIIEPRLSDLIDPAETADE
jgi:hypothetical protein